MEEIAYTSVSEVYDNFLSSISDYSLLANTITDEEINEELSSYLKKAKTKFYRCKNSLKTFIDVDGEEKFESELTPFEIEVLSILMLVQYMRPMILSSDVLKQSLSDKDFKIYSQANQLRELRLLYENLKREASKAITEYTFIGIEKEKM